MGASSKDQISWALNPCLLSEKVQPFLPAGRGSTGFWLLGSRQLELWTLLAKLQAWGPDSHHEPHPAPHHLGWAWVSSLCRSRDGSALLSKAM